MDGERIRFIYHMCNFNLLLKSLIRVLERLLKLSDALFSFF
jgi:hypothetical protein